MTDSKLYEDIAKYFARGRRDDNLLGEGRVGSKTINNSRIFSAESIRKFTKKYGQKALNKVQEKLFTELKIWMKEQGDKGIETELKALTRFKGDTTNWRKGGD